MSSEFLIVVHLVSKFLLLLKALNTLENMVQLSNQVLECRHKTEKTFGNENTSVVLAISGSLLANVSDLVDDIGKSLMSLGALL